MRTGKAMELNKETILKCLGETLPTRADDAGISCAIEAFRKWDTRLLEAIGRQRPTREILEIASEMLDNPVALFDASGSLLCYAGKLPDGPTGTVWDEIRSRGSLSTSFYSHEEMAATTKLLQTECEPVVVKPRREHGHSHLLAEITVGGKAFGLLSQVDIYAEFTESQRFIFSHIRDRLALMAEAHVGWDRHSDPLAHCMRQLLAGEKVESGAIRFQVRQQGWEASEILRVLVAPSPSGYEELHQKTLLSHLASRLPYAKCFLFDEAVVCVMRETDMSPDAARFEAMIDDAVGDTSVTCGLSSQLIGLENLRSAHRQALYAIESARERGGGEDERRIILARFDDEWLPHVLARLREKDDLETLGDQRLTSLWRAGRLDAQTVSHLLAYLSYGCNATRAAKAVFLHRNTLDYRISRLEEALGMRFEELDLHETQRLVLSCLLILEEERAG